MRVETRCCKNIETEDWKNENDALSSKIPRQLSRERPHTVNARQEAISKLLESVIVSCGRVEPARMGTVLTCLSISQRRNFNARP